MLLIMLDSPSRNRQTERREATRSEILTAAWDIAGEKGLADLTLGDVGARIGMRAPSLYSYFDSKNAIYDAMFGQAWTGYLAVMDSVEPTLPRSPRAGLKKIARTFFDYAAADLARHQLMNQRTIPGFVPSRESYAPAVEALERTRGQVARYGVTSPDMFDLFTALIGGLIDAQQANQPGGDRWARLLDQGMDMFADYLALPGSRRRST
jgi:AcrR family transcriptional regulator